MTPWRKQKGPEGSGLGTFPQCSIFVSKSFRECCSESNNQSLHHLSACAHCRFSAYLLLEDSNLFFHWYLEIYVFKFLGIFYMVIYIKSFPDRLLEPFCPAGLFTALLLPFCLCLCLSVSVSLSVCLSLPLCFCPFISLPLSLCLLLSEWNGHFWTLP